MAKVITLGTAAAVSDEKHANTHLAVTGEKGFFLIDCAGNPVVRLKQAHLAHERLRGLIITHFHPDHVGGIPILLMNIWLLGHTAPLPMYGLASVMERFETMMNLFYWHEWPNLFPVPLNAIAEKVGAPVFEDDQFRVTAAPVEHLVPTIGLRIENKHSGRVAAYSSDTSPCDAVVELARDADVLIHEAAEDTLGHSSAAQAGEIARRAGAKRLVLIHYRPSPKKYARWVQEATATFGGPVELAQDFGAYEF